MSYHSFAVLWLCHFRRRQEWSSISCRFNWGAELIHSHFRMNRCLVLFDLGGIVTVPRGNSCTAGSPERDFPALPLLIHIVHIETAVLRDKIFLLKFPRQRKDRFSQLLMFLGCGGGCVCLFNLRHDEFGGRHLMTAVLEGSTGHGSCHV